MLESFYTIIFFALVSLTIANSFVITPQNHYKFIVFLGKYSKTARSGFSFKIPFLTWVDKKVYTGIVTKRVSLSLKTKDQLTFNIDFDIQYKISDNISLAYKSVYEIDDIGSIMTGISKKAAIESADSILLENVFQSTSTITDNISSDLKNFFEEEFGINIVNVLPHEPELPKEVEDQYNRILIAKRDKEAASNEAEAIKIRKIGEATADGESAKIRMEKLGESRTEYAGKAREAIEILVKSGLTPSQASNFLNNITDNDAILTASRNGGTVIFSQQGSSQNNGMDNVLCAIERLKKHENK